MTLSVADRSSNKPESIEHAVEVIGRSKQRKAVFQAIYAGKSPTKSVQQLIKATGLEHTRVLDAGKALADNAIVHTTRVGGGTAYSKIEFFARYRDKILRFVENPKKLTKVATKRRPSVGSSRGVLTPLTVRVPTSSNRARPITIDDIDNFKKVRRVSATGYVKMSETAFKNGVARILGEKAQFKDWGGELRDLSSTRLKIGGTRHATAFAFKGPGKSGRLTPKKMGANGDQIQRLAKCPAEVFLVQYWRDIDDSVYEQLEKLIQVKSFFEGRRLRYGIIDGTDSARLIQAYAKEFGSSGRSRRNSPKKR